MRVFSVVILLILSLFSCKNNDNNYLDLDVNDGKYRLIESNNGENAKPGEFIIYSVLFKDNNGKVFLDKREKGNFLREQVMKDRSLMKDTTAVSEVLYKLSKGDSAIIVLPLTEDEKRSDMKNSDTLFFYLKVKDIVDEAGMRDIVEDEFLKQEAEQTEARFKKVEVDQTIMKAWDEYNKGKLKGKLNYTDNGVEYLIIEKGEGEKAKKGQKVKIGYYGMTNKGANTFDNSFNRGKDVEIVAGGGQVIPGWDEALLEMNNGMKAVFFIPYKLAYGEEGKLPIIPAKSDLVLYIELHEIIK